MSARRPGERLVRGVHEWLGLVCLAGLLVVGATGAAIVFLGELFVAQYGDMVRVSAEERARPLVAVDRLVQGAEAGYGRPFSAQGVLMPHSRIPLDVALVFGAPPGGAADEPLMLAVNPHTGEYQGHFWLDDALGHELVHLHADLLAGESGRLVVVALGLAVVLFTASGLYLWWPRTGSALRKLTATTLRRPSLTVFALHGLLGIWLGPLLVFYALTGIATAKPQWLGPLMVSPFSQGPAVPDAAAGNAPGGWISLAEAVAIGQAEHPGRRLASLRFEGEGQAVGMTFKAPGDLDRYYGDGHAWVDRRDGRLLEAFVAGERSPATGAGAIMHSLHAGLHFGVAGVAVTVVTGLVLTLLSALGTVLWWRRRAGVRAARMSRLPT